MQTLKVTLAGILVLLFTFSLNAEEMLNIDSAKQRGLIGEDAGGYLGAVQSPTPAVTALIADINEKRLAEYKRIAAANNITLSDVEKLAGRKAIERTDTGYFIRLPGTTWMKKPAE